ncbi:MAG: dihydrofolate reductase family protein [Gemmatimonadota bacterium]|nr:dihydrofolate reductase family protein [Gemmatimonadota bacterium]
MRRLTVFNNVSLDGYFTDANGDMSWAHNNDPEWNAFAAENASGGGALLLGRITYDLMAGFWPTPRAMETMPAVAKGMNSMPKFVVSRTLRDPAWSNTTVVKGDLARAVRKLKQESGPDIAILGSGSIVSQLAQEGLIDEFQIVVQPIALGSGRTLFEGVKEKLRLERTKSRTFGNGSVFACYEPVAR